MAHVLTLTDAQLEAICERSPDCGCNCARCEAFAANMRYNNGDYENDSDSDNEEEDWDDGYWTQW